MKISSVGQKIVMSISGMFLVLFLAVHLAVNLSSIISQKAYETASRFMSENIFIKSMVPVLALGLIVHIVMAIILTIQNRKARPVGYKVKSKVRVSWASQNMFVLGIIILGFLLLHLSHFWAKMQFQHLIGHTGENPYDLVRFLFSNGLYVTVYIIWILALCFHLTHGFWSMFQSIGLNNEKWIPRLKMMAIIYSHIIMLGYIAIPVYFYWVSLR